MPPSFGKLGCPLPLPLHLFLGLPHIRFLILQRGRHVFHIRHQLLLGSLHNRDPRLGSRQLGLHLTNPRLERPDRRLLIRMDADQPDNLSLQRTRRRRRFTPHLGLHTRLGHLTPRLFPHRIRSLLRRPRTPLGPIQLRL